MYMYKAAANRLPRLLILLTKNVWRVRIIFLISTISIKKRFQDDNEMITEPEDLLPDYYENTI